MTVCDHLMASGASHMGWFARLSEFGTSRVEVANLGFRSSGAPKVSDDKGASGCLISSPAEVLDVIEESGRETVQPHAILVWVDDVKQTCDQPEFLSLGADDLEHGLLDTMAKGLAGPCYFPKPRRSFRCGCLNVVGDEKVHQVIVQGT